ncbi:MAG: hypothetical protein JXQ83_01095 [Candidatus Glassbacteria bacterium]|nr:hypothetical protein [Candidatus Glassbacteria bacterium]
MRISEYRFGRIVIDGRAYDADVIICGPRVIDNWRRSRGHLLEAADLDKVQLAAGMHLVVGTGYSGCMTVSAGLKEYCRQNEVGLEAWPTPQAVERFNSLPGGREIVGAFHLTC